MGINKTFFYIAIVTILSGCAQSTAFLGPAITVAATVNVVQGGFTYGTNEVFKKETGKDTIQYVSSLLEPEDKNLLKPEDKKSKIDEDLIALVESSIKNGAFTQILHMVRLNNQQGIGVAPFQNTNITSAFVQKNTDGGKNVYTDESMFGILDYDETSPLNEKQTEKLNNLGKKQFIEGKLPWELDK